MIPSAIVRGRPYLVKQVQCRGSMSLHTVTEYLGTKFAKTTATRSFSSSGRQDIMQKVESFVKYSDSNIII